VVISVVGLVCVGFLDWITGAEISLSLIYLVPISLGAWFAGRRAAVILSLLGAGFWLFFDLQQSAFHTHVLVPYWNAAVRLGIFLFTSWLLVQLRERTQNLDELVQRRTTALQAEVKHRQALEREAVEISHREQERVAHELHDTLAANLGGVAFRLKALSENLERRGLPESLSSREALEAVNSAIMQVRSFARLLDPVQGGASNLAHALSRMGAEVERVFGIPCPVEVSPALPPLSTDQTLHLYRIAQEAVRNAVQHGNPSRVDVAADCRDGHIELVVRNDGKTWALSDQSTTGLGLRIMRHRCEILGGTLSIDAHDKGGTLLKCRVPLGAAKTTEASNDSADGHD
jgi:signal transduction histidine kinase